jgi:hypothetical protein
MYAWYAQLNTMRRVMCSRVCAESCEHNKLGKIILLRCPHHASTEMGQLESASTNDHGRRPIRYDMRSLEQTIRAVLRAV